MLNQLGVLERAPARRLEQRLRAPPVVAQRAPTAQELEAQVSAHPLPLQYLDDPDLAGAPRVRAAAGRDVPVRDLDDTDSPPHLGRLAQRKALHALLVDPVPHDLAVLPHDPVQDPLEALDRTPIDVGEPHLDRAALLAQVGRERLRAELALERRREHVLPGVLLHVLEAAGPVDLRLEWRNAGDVLGQHVPDAPGLVELDVHDRRAADPPAVGLLPPLSG